MAHITLATIGSLGDLHPVLALADGLKQRGHQTRIATTLIYEERVLRRGHEFAPLRPVFSLEDKEEIARMMHPLTGPEYLIGKVILGSIEETYEDLMRATNETDLLISQEMVFPARFVAEKKRLPWASVALAPVSYFSRYDDPVFLSAPWLRHISKLGPSATGTFLKLAVKVTDRWLTPYHTLRTQLALPDHGNPLFYAKHSPQASLALFSAHFAPPRPDWPTPTIQCGFPFYQGDAQTPLSATVERFLQAGPPPLIFTLGSAAVHTPGEFFQVAYEGAKKAGRRALFIAGENALPIDNNEQFHVEPYIPYEQVFPHCSLIAHQGGIGTTAQGLRSGTPQLIVPFAFDQPDNAHRIVRMGCGYTCPRRKWNVANLHSLLQKHAEDQRIKETSQNIGKLINTENGVLNAIKALESTFLINT